MLLLELLILGACLLGVLVLWLRLHAAEVVLKLHGARRVDPEEAPLLFRATVRLSIAAGIAVPQLYSIEKREPRAFSVGGRKRAYLVVTTGLLQREDGAKAVTVLAGEIGHIVHGHVLRANAFAVIGSLIDALVSLSPRKEAADQFRGLVAHQLRRSRSSRRRRAAARLESQRLLGLSPQQWRASSRYFPRSGNRKTRRHVEPVHRYGGGPIAPEDRSSDADPRP